ncbi:MAG: AAA family ATPase [Anaerolineales bacterium]|nr:AAA family ATPase [Anaerolineales bacterium]
MSKTIDNRYVLQTELVNIDMGEAYLAQDLQAGLDEFVQVYIVNTPKASELVHQIVFRRANELMLYNHPAYLSMCDYGYDSRNNCYYFVYPYGGAGKAAAHPLGKYITQMEPSLKWSCEFLLALAGFLHDLHARDIAHGGLRSGCILLTNPLHHEILVSNAGLQNLIDMLEGRTGAVDQGSFELDEAADIRSFGEIATELLCRKMDPTLSEVRRAIQALPEEIRQEFEQLAGLTPEVNFTVFSEVKRTLEYVLRKVQAEEIYYLCLTNKAISTLHEVGFIDLPKDYIATHFLNKEFERSVYGWAEPARDGDGMVYRLTTSQMRLWCVPDSHTTPSRHFVIIGIGLRDPADLSIDREHGYKILTRLHIDTNAKVPPFANIKPLASAIDAHTEKRQQVTQADLEDKGRFKMWQDLLDQQQRLLREFQLRYAEWEESDAGASLKLFLRESPEEDAFGLSEDDLLCMTGDDGRQHPVGYYEDLTGNILKFGLVRNIDTSKFKDSGLVTLDKSQVEAVLFRQQKAMKRLRFRETVNPNLPDILSDPGTLCIDNPSVVDMWFQAELDESQRKAVQRALATRDMFLVQGPPGTGKTSVIAELVLQIIERQEHARILVTSQSNVAVNNALDKIVELRPGLSEYVVRVGREEKAGTTEGLLLDRQLQNWREKVIQRSDDYFTDLEEKASGGKKLSEALGVLDECQDIEVRLQQREAEIQEAQKKLGELNREYESLENTINRAQQLRQQAESILAEAAPGDEDLRRMISTFQNDYLDWATAFLDQANQVAGISFLRSETLEKIKILQTEIDRYANEIESGISLVNEFLQSEYKISYTTLEDLRGFIDRNYIHQKEEMAKLGRIRRLVDEWKQQVGKNYRDFASAYLSRCKVVGATCIGVAAKGDVSDLEFDWVIVDEAGKATHPELLVPLVRGRKMVLVGDHRQLPPTIGRDLDEAIQKADGVHREMLQTSLFQELIEGAQKNVKLPLTIQYRMHPAIGTLIGECFYSDVGLQNGVQEQERQHMLEWCPRSVVWYSTKKLPEHSEVRSGYSRMNQAEVDSVLALLDQIEASYTSAGIFDKTVGVITGYLAQKAAIRQKVSAGRARWPHIQDVEVDTVDAYQGRERDIIIYSVVRSNPQGKIGFLQDERRLNVALSRARELLIIVGDEDIEFAGGRSNPFFAVIHHIRHHPADCALEALRHGR